MYNTVYIPRMD
ncbi:hypothetical protein KSF78_0000503 [Schistosoma japonicum]|nr:hypothetical protein KSF78_0000503 [Schistosoma japonicum]KAH8850364.1 hypothetical protein KSF78_0000503 [Schistosoma japonicum]